MIIGCIIIDISKKIFSLSLHLYKQSLRGSGSYFHIFNINSKRHWYFSTEIFYEWRNFLCTLNNKQLCATICYVISLLIAIAFDCFSLKKEKKITKIFLGPCTNLILQHMDIQTKLLWCIDINTMWFCKELWVLLILSSAYSSMEKTYDSLGASTCVQAQAADNFLI